MRVQLQQIPPEGLEREEFLPPAWAVGELEGEAAVAEPGLAVVVRLQRVGQDILVEGRIEGTLRYPCDRCLEEARQPIDLQFTLLAGDPRPQDLVEEEVELQEDDLSFVPIQGQEVVLDEVIREQIILAIPMVRECSEHCKGLCAGCGRNLNHESCGCQTEPSDPRWAALAKIKLD